MLASIMPGVREIRTPLATGYAWILVVYLAVGHRLPDAASSTGLLADVYRIGRLVTPAGIAVAVSVVAYLTGVVVQPLASMLTKVVLKWRRVVPDRLARVAGKPPEEQIKKAFEGIEIDRLADRVRDDAQFRAAVVRHGVEVSRHAFAGIDASRLDDLLLKKSAVRQQAVQEAVTLDASRHSVKLSEDLLRQMVQRMQRHADRAATEYDRHTTESDFRAGMAWPLLGLLVVLSVRVSVWWLGGLPAVILLLSSASAASLQATMLLMTVIASRGYDEPAIQSLDTTPPQQLINDKAGTARWVSPAALAVTALAISADNKMIAGGTSDGLLLVWDADTGSLRHSVAAHRDTIEALAFTPDGSRLVTSSQDDTTLVWDCTSGTQLRVLVPRHAALMV
ncbi:WD40 repeat domain-containing protein [Catellatospora tritici]|uniref:WD40 repeat domain-containing protein n=1 Tax=Catellatospora tritici TaxID=2851566 RepID=UPI001C2D18FC|nr:hypothetical protein [Catellatospora tritici]MBV1856694.1 hypothetical protein [Catellatospora tritici]